MGYASDGGRADRAWTDNDERRNRANYAWQHPSRRGQPGAGQDAASAAGARPDPFASRRSRAYHYAGTDHMATYAGRAQTRFAQQQAAGLNGDKHWRAGTAIFGQQKAEEESRLINDSSSLRTGQVRRPVIVSGCTWLTDCRSDSLRFLVGRPRFCRRLRHCNRPLARRQGQRRQDISTIDAR